MPPGSWVVTRCLFVFFFFSSRWEIKSNTIIIFFYFNFIFILFLFGGRFSLGRGLTVDCREHWRDSLDVDSRYYYCDYYCFFSSFMIVFLDVSFLGFFFFFSFPRNSSRFLLFIFYSLSFFSLFFLTWLQFLTFRRDDGLLYRSLCYHYAAVATAAAAARIGKHLYAKSQENSTRVSFIFDSFYWENLFNHWNQFDHTFSIRLL